MTSFASCNFRSATVLSLLFLHFTSFKLLSICTSLSSLPHERPLTLLLSFKTGLPVSFVTALDISLFPFTDCLPLSLGSYQKDSASGISSKTGALGEGSVGGNTSGKGTESNAGGREMGDSDSSMKGDTVSLSNLSTLPRRRAPVPKLCKDER